MKRFLIAAYACEPDKGSEPGVGWNWALEIAKENKVIVITRSNNKNSIEKYLEKNKCNNLSFQYCDIPKKLSFWKKGQKGLYLYYLFWQIYCYKFAKELMRLNKFDYIMTITFGNMWLPTFMHRLPCDFIWGPVGGGEAIPKEFWNRIGIKQRIFEQIRSFNKFFPISNPFFYNICNKSKLIIVRTEDSFKCIPKKHQHKCLLCIETGISQKDLEEYDNITEKNPNKTCFDFVVVGKLSTLKQVNIAIDAFEKIKNNENVGKLHIIGDGDQKKNLLQLAKKYNLQEKIVFYGRVTHNQTLKIMKSCDATVMPSLKEGGSWVMYETMLLKKPMICFNHAGMSVVETDDTAMMIPVLPYNDAVGEFANAMEYLVNNKKASYSMGIEGYEHLKNNLRWNTHVDKMFSTLEINLKKGR